MSTPSNHHYVPQHFLRTWSTDKEGNKLNRYKKIARTGTVEFKLDVAIRSSASEKNLYVITDGSESAEFETIVMTDQLDTPGAKVIRNVIENGIGNLSQENLITLSKYVTSLEARNPKTIAEMRLSKSDLDKIGDKNRGKFSDKSIDEVMSFLSKIDVGRYASGLFVTLDSEFLNAVLKCFILEIKLPDNQLVTSTYPVGRLGRYDEQFMLVLAVAPNHAIIWFSDEIRHQAISQVPLAVQAKFINVLTIGDADVAFTNNDFADPFVTEHLGWRIGLDNIAQKSRLKDLMDLIQL